MTCCAHPVLAHSSTLRGAASRVRLHPPAATRQPLRTNNHRLQAGDGRRAPAPAAARRRTLCSQAACNAAGCLLSVHGQRPIRQSCLFQFAFPYIFSVLRRLQPRLSLTQQTLQTHTGAFAARGAAPRQGFLGVARGCSRGRRRGRLGGRCIVLLRRGLAHDGLADQLWLPQRGARLGARARYHRCPRCAGPQPPRLQHSHVVKTP